MSAFSWTTTHPSEICMLVDPPPNAPFRMTVPDLSAVKSSGPCSPTRYVLPASTGPQRARAPVTLDTALFTFCPTEESAFVAADFADSMMLATYSFAACAFFLSVSIAAVTLFDISSNFAPM